MCLNGRIAAAQTAAARWMDATAARGSVKVAQGLLWHAPWARPGGVAPKASRSAALPNAAHSGPRRARLETP